jgi:hypothetical protein
VASIHPARVLILTRLWAKTPCPHQYAELVQGAVDGCEAIAAVGGDCRWWAPGSADDPFNCRRQLCCIMGISELDAMLRRKDCLPQRRLLVYSSKHDGLNSLPHKGIKARVPLRRGRPADCRLGAAGQPNCSGKLFSAKVLLGKRISGS